MMNLKVKVFIDGKMESIIKVNLNKVTCMVMVNFIGLKVKFLKVTLKMI